jgi:hypothetical protein
MARGPHLRRLRKNARADRKEVPQELKSVLIALRRVRPNKIRLLLFDRLLPNLREKEKKTADLSTTLRSGRDDKFV